MARSTWGALLLAVGILVWPAERAQATGLGFFLEGGGGSGEMTWDWDTAGENEFDIDSSRFGIGFTLDTNLAKNQVFGYRLAVGYSAVDLDPEMGGRTLQLRGLTIDNTFAFGIVRTRVFRLWVGPQLHLGFYAGELEDYSDYDAAVFAFGIGPIIGANLNLGKTLTLALSLGFRVVGYGGTMETSWDDGTLSGNDSHAFGNLSVFFRLPGDSYSR